MKLLTGKEEIFHTDKTVLDFWSWAYSDIFSNRNQSIFGEFLVASALGLTQTHRVEWAAIDLIYQDLKIEVKTSSYLQNWAQNKLSDIRFDISCKRTFNEDTNKYSEEAIRCADIYIFCLFTETVRGNVNVIDAEKWNFYLVETSELNRLYTNYKTLALAKIQSLANPVKWKDLKQEVDSKHFLGN